MLSDYFEPSHQLKPLPYPVYFVCKNAERWSDLIKTNRLPEDLTDLYKRCGGSSDIWSAQTYIVLKNHGLQVHLVPRPVPDQICVIPYERLLIQDLAFNSYVVACRYDRARPEICEQRIVLNKLNILDQTDHFMPHWPQPLLQPRDSARGTMVKNLVFKGSSSNLAAPFKTPSFLQALQDLGIGFQCSIDNPETQFDDWRDYRQADVVLAIRDSQNCDFAIKPALKLVNTWFAECPAILGPEPAYQDLRKSGLDYIEARRPEEVIAALKRLKEHPELYRSMVENGRLRSQEFRPSKVAQVWRDVLAGPVAKDYAHWQQQPLSQKVLGRPMQFMLRTFKHKREYYRYLASTHRLPRPLAPVLLQASQG